jgi:hypothetical protein
LTAKLWTDPGPHEYVVVVAAPVDLTGQTFGLLTVVGLGAGRKRLCRCACGGTKETTVSNYLQKDIAKAFGVHKAHIANIKNGHKWGEL